MMTINPNIYPKTGFVFKDTDGAVLTGDSWSGVIVRVIEYRKRQGRPFDRAHEEVIAQACQGNPELCKNDSGINQQALQVASIKSRVLKWLNGIREAKQRGEHPVFVPEPLRDARADVCRRCPLDRSMPGGCSSCKAALEELRKEIIGGRKGEERVAACPILGEYLPVSVWIEQQSVANPELPPECWRKRTL